MSAISTYLANILSKRKGEEVRGSIHDAIEQCYRDVTNPTLLTDGIEEILEMQKGVIRVRPAAFTCDAYLFFSGDRDAVNAYRGEYMSAYSWASMTESMMYWKVVDQS